MKIWDPLDDYGARPDFAAGVCKLVVLSHRVPPVVLASEASGRFGRHLHGALDCTWSLVEGEQPFVSLHGCVLGLSRHQSFPSIRRRGQVFVETGSGRVCACCPHLQRAPRGKCPCVVSSRVRTTALPHRLGSCLRDSALSAVPVVVVSAQVSPHRRWKRDWSNHIWLIFKEVLISPTQKPVVSVSSVQSCVQFVVSHDSGFQRVIQPSCMKKSSAYVYVCWNGKIVTVRPAPYEFLEGAQRYQYPRVGKYYVMLSRLKPGNMT